MSHDVGMGELVLTQWQNASSVSRSAQHRYEGPSDVSGQAIEVQPCRSGGCCTEGIGRERPTGENGSSRQSLRFNM